jgi:hypothetical protein
LRRAKEAFEINVGQGSKKKEAFEINVGQGSGGKSTSVRDHKINVGQGSLDQNQRRSGITRDH